MWFLLTVWFLIPSVFGTDYQTQMVKIQCGDGAMTLTLNKEFFGTGFWLRETDVTLGPNKCQVTSGDASGVLVFHYPLESCGSILSLTSEDMLYTNHLNFEPVIRMGIVRSNSAKLQVLCKYPRKGNASSYDVKPTWIPFYSTKVERSKFAFSLHLMMDDWLEERPSNIYQLGQVMHIEARVHTPNHVNMRLYIDKCVARSSVPGSTTTYSIIENHGCLVDGKVGFDGHLTSRFITRTSNNILQFTLDSFRFSHESTDEVYITCRVKVAESSTSPNNVAKACSYTLASKWQSADGNHMVCSCCESVCARRKRDVVALDVEEEVVLGPVVILDAERTAKGQILRSYPKAYQVSLENELSAWFLIILMVTAATFCIVSVIYFVRKHYLVVSSV